MDTEILRVKYTYGDFEADVNREGGEAVIKYKGENVPDYIVLNIDHLQQFADFIAQIAKEENT